MHESLPYPIIAQTIFISIGSGFELYSINPLVSNWDMNLIEINNPVMPTLSAYEQQGTMAHEIGHAMGLAHNDNHYSIMCQLGNGRVVSNPDSDDVNGVNYLY